MKKYTKILTSCGIAVMLFYAYKWHSKHQVQSDEQEDVIVPPPTPPNIPDIVQAPVDDKHEEHEITNKPTLCDPNPIDEKKSKAPIAENDSSAYIGCFNSAPTTFKKVNTNNRFVPRAKRHYHKPTQKDKDKIKKAIDEGKCPSVIAHQLHLSNMATYRCIAKLEIKQAS